MPELPEVETLKQELAASVKNKKFADVFCDAPKLLNKKLPEFKKIIKNKKVKSISRRGKMLIFELGNDLYLLIHLKMSGQLIYRKQMANGQSQIVTGGHPQPGGLDNLPNKFTHIYFTFSDKSVLYFNDMRKFGWARLVDLEKLNKVGKEFGIEPMSKDFTLSAFKEILKHRQNKKIKQILLEQKLIAGIGNIYADESCFCAKILPTRKAESLKPAEILALHKCIIRVLKLAISKKGTSFNLYVKSDGNSGGMLPFLNVYGRQGEKCKRCKSIIKKIKLNGRGTHFCNSCQK